MSFHAIIPAGGAGTRLWPLSRKTAPKFLADLTGSGRSLLQQTVDRLEGLASQTTVVTGAAHAAAVAEQVPGVDVVVEPGPKGTMGAIGLAAAIVAARDGQAIVGSFAADHLIRDEHAFREAVRTAIGAAEQGYLATIGITPDRPSTAYGYIEVGASLRAGADSGGDTPDGTFGPGRRADRGAPAPSVAKRASAFVEKPDAATAAEYLATGRYLWNAGMFVAKATALMDALERFHPEIAGPLRALAAAWDGEGRQAAIAQHWPDLPSAVIDRAIAEPLAELGGVAVVPVEMGWSDVGDYASLAEIVPDADRLRGVVPGAARPQPVLAVDSPGALVYSGGKPVVVVGMPQAVVVDMDDVVLVTTQDAAQSVKGAVDGLGEAGLEELS